MTLLATAAIAAATEGTGAWVGETLGPKMVAMFADRTAHQVEDLMISKVAAEAIKSVAISAIDYTAEGMRDGGGEGDAGGQTQSDEQRLSGDVVGTFFFMQGLNRPGFAGGS